MLLLLRGHLSLHFNSICIINLFCFLVIVFILTLNAKFLNLVAIEVLKFIHYSKILSFIFHLYSNFKSDLKSIHYSIDNHFIFINLNKIFKEQCKLIRMVYLCYLLLFHFFNCFIYSFYHHQLSELDH